MVTDPASCTVQNLTCNLAADKHTHAQMLCSRAWAACKLVCGAHTGRTCSYGARCSYRNEVACKGLSYRVGVLIQG